MKLSLSRQRFAIGLSAAIVIALAVALVPGAQASGSLTSCGNKQIKAEIQGAEGEKPVKTTIPIKDIAVKGTTCAAAYEFLKLTFSGEKISSTGYPQNYKCKPATFKVPVGYFGQSCTKPGKTINYATRGG